MAWTVPRTYTAGEKPTALMFNTHIRDNLTHLWQPPLARYVTWTTFSTTSTTFTIMDALNMNWTLVTSGRRIKLSMYGNIYNATSGAVGYIDVSIDGVQVNASFGIRSIGLSNLGTLPFSLEWISAGNYAAGSHTIVPIWKTSTGTLSMLELHAFVTEI